MSAKSKASQAEMRAGAVATLQARWSSAVVEHTSRLSTLLGQQEVLFETCKLLSELAELGDPRLDERSRFQSVLTDVGRLQSNYGLTPPDMTALLAVVREALASAQKEDPSLATLLDRLGLVFFESSMRPHLDHSDGGARALEYALLYERARQMAITDSLTGLHNFGYFRDRLREERARAERYQHLLSLIVLDLDHFKHYNDTNGHPAGNEVLEALAELLTAEARETDLVARYGGEEFVVLLPETSRKTAWEVAERIRGRVRSTHFANMSQQPLGRVTLSAGVATFPVDAIHEDDLVQRADESLYEAKSRGRDRVVAYEPANKVAIVYHAEHGVERVALVGSFNNWDPEADAMKRTADGTYEFIMSLNPGVYRYKFVLDGTRWIADPTQPETQPDDMGGLNSVLRVS